MKLPTYSGLRTHPNGPLELSSMHFRIWPEAHILTISPKTINDNPARYVVAVGRPRMSITVIASGKKNVRRLAR